MHLYCRERIRFHDVIARSRDFIDFILTILTSLDDRRAQTGHFNHRNFVIEAKLPYYRSAPITLVYYRRYPTVVVTDNTILCKIAYPTRLFCHLSISTTNVCNPDFHPQLRLVTANNDVSKLDTKPPNINRAIFQNRILLPTECFTLCRIDFA